MFRKKILDKIKIHILCPIIFFSKIVLFMSNVEKYCRSVQATDDNVAKAHCTLGTWRYKHTLRIVIQIAFLLQ